MAFAYVRKVDEKRTIVLRNDNILSVQVAVNDGHPKRLEHIIICRLHRINQGTRPISHRDLPRVLADGNAAMVAVGDDGRLEITPLEMLKTGAILLPNRGKALH